MNNKCSAAPPSIKFQEIWQQYWTNFLTSLMADFCSNALNKAPEYTIETQGPLVQYFATFGSVWNSYPWANPLWYFMLLLTEKKILHCIYTSVTQLSLCLAQCQNINFANDPVFLSDTSIYSYFASCNLIKLTWIYFVISLKKKKITKVRKTKCPNSQLQYLFSFSTQQLL